jgi:hypothetical protein
MIKISIDQFKDDPEKYVRTAIVVGYMFTIDTGKGKAVLMDEAEYKTIKRALAAALASGGTSISEEMPSPN